MKPVYTDTESMVRRSPVSRAILAGVIDWAITQIRENISGDIQDISCNDAGVFIEYSVEDYCKGCHMGTDYYSYLIPWDDFFDGNTGSWMVAEDNRKADEEKAKRLLAEEQEKERRRKAQEEKDKADYERLKTKFEG